MASELTPERMTVFKDAFARFDINGNGVIEDDELMLVMQISGLNPTKAEVADLLKKMDKDGNDKVELQEFIALLEKHEVVDPIEEQVKLLQYFKLFDKNGDGTITADEFAHVLQNCGERLNDEELHYFFHCMDRDECGNLLYPSFVDLMMSKY